MDPAPTLVFGPAGLLRERIEGAEAPDLFLSANLEHLATRAAGIHPFGEGPGRPWGAKVSAGCRLGYEHGVDR
jgi:hypothetical protein